MKHTACSEFSHKWTGRDGRTDRQTDTPTYNTHMPDRQTGRHTHTYAHTDRQTDTHIRAHRQTDRHRHTDTDTHTHTDYLRHPLKAFVRVDPGICYHLINCYLIRHQPIAKHRRIISKQFVYQNKNNNKTTR